MSSSSETPTSRAPNSLWRVWEDHPALTIPGTSYTLIGFSIAALRTNFYIRELNLMLDAGISANLCPDLILVTHGHADHTANLPFHLYRPKDLPPCRVLVPAPSVEPFRDMIGSAYALSTGKTFNPRLVEHWELVPASPGTTLDINIGKRPFRLEIIECYHSLPCVGYGLLERRMKLKPEYVGLPGAEIAALRRSGKEVSAEVELPILLFLGDTSCQVLKDPRLERYPVIMIECTFVDLGDLEQAAETKHMHWSQLSPYVLEHPKTTFILYHFSQRYKPEWLKAYFVGVGLANVIPWIN